MQHFISLILMTFGVLWSGVSSAASNSPLSLQIVYSAALNKTETVGIQEAITDRVSEQVSQARGRIFPSIALSASYLRQDTPEIDGSALARQIGEPDQLNSRITLTQPLFRGLGEFAALRSVQAEVQAQQANTHQARLNLYSSVARAYFDVLLQEQDLENLKTLINLTSRRVEDLRQRSQIGRSREGEVLTAQSQLAVLRSQLQGLEGQVARARDQFALTTGLDRDTSLRKVSQKNLPSSLNSVSDFLDQIEKRPDIHAVRLQLEAADENIWAVRSQHLPTVDFTGNYYLKRSGSLEGSKWDVGFQVILPIFQGGVIQSQVRQASLLTRERELLLSQARRTAEAEIKSLHRFVRAGLDQIKALREALVISERNYQKQNQDYRLGLVTNLEVLQALNVFQETKRSLDRITFQTLAEWASLRAAIGETDFESI